MIPNKNLACDWKSDPDGEYDRTLSITAPTDLMDGNVVISAQRGAESFEIEVPVSIFRSLMNEVSRTEDGESDLDRFLRLRRMMAVLTEPPPSAERH